MGQASDEDVGLEGCYKDLLCVCVCGCVDYGGVRMES